jgi:mono/diheme cytochrome c family protein
MAAGVTAITLLCGCTSAPEIHETASALLASKIEEGRHVASRECASCHAIDRLSSSRNASAPPLRDVLGANALAFLPFRLTDAMRVGHREMPQFDFDPPTADALVAYIQSLSAP